MRFLKSWATVTATFMWGCMAYAGDMPKISGFIDGSLTYSDNGEKGDDLQSSSMVSTHRADLSISGSPSADTAYHINLRFLDPTNATNAVDQAYLKWMPNGMVTISAGRQVTDTSDYPHAFANSAGSAYKSQFPGRTHIIGLDFAVAGNISVQILDDPKPCYAYDADKNCTSSGWNSHDQLTAILGWQGDYGVVSPYVFFSQYDSSHSNFVTVGTKFASGAITGMLSVTMDNWAAKVAKTSGTGFEDNVTKHQQIRGQVNYDAGKMLAYTYFENHTVTEDPDVKGGNTTMIALGSRFNRGAVTPYVELRNTTKTQQDPTDSDKEESFSGMGLQVGLHLPF